MIEHHDEEACTGVCWTYKLEHDGHRVRQMGRSSERRSRETEYKGDNSHSTMYHVRDEKEY